MIRASDWYLFQPGVRIPDEIGGGGFWIYQGKPYVHRAIVPELPSNFQQLVGQPLWAADIPAVDGVAGANLRPYQLEGAAFCAERDGSVLAYQMGCGKTRTALYAVRASSGSAPYGLVVAPKVTWSVWRKEIALVFGDLPVHEIRGLAPTDDPLELRRRETIYLINPEILHARWPEWLGTRLDWTLLDEAQFYTRGKTLRTQAVAALANLSKQRIALTGTPILRHAMDLHGILAAVAPGALGSWKQTALWLGFVRTAHGWDLQALSSSGRDRLETRLAQLLVRKRWEEVAVDVPPLQRERLPIELDLQARTVYEHLASDVRAVLGDVISLVDLSSAAGTLIQLTALRRFVGRAKIQAVVELVRSVGEPVVVWAWHRDAVHEIADQLRKHKLRVVEVTGEDSDKDRQQAIRAFQGGSADVFVGTMAAGGVGIDLTQARITVMAELSYVPADIAQAEARVFRSGQTRPCVTYWPIVADTVEDRMIEILIRKADHACEDIFPGGVVKTQQEVAEEEMISLLTHAMEETD